MRNGSAQARIFATCLAACLLAAAPGERGESCLAAAGSRTPASAAMTEYAFRKPGAAVDARGVEWRGVRGHAVKLAGDQPACWRGGRVAGPYPEDAVYECSPEHCPKGVCPEPCWPYHISAGISARVAAPLTLEDVHVSAYGDGISQEESARRAPLVLRRIHLEDIHDDAVENDWGASVRISDSLFERVNIAFASRQRVGTRIDARSQTFEIRNSLIQLHRFTNQYKGRPGAGGFWKWGHAGLDPQLVVVDNVFLADTRGGGLLFPLVDQTVECRNNRLLWAGTQADWEASLDEADDSDGLDNRGRLAALAHCYTVTLKPASQSPEAFLAEHWDPLVRRWKEAHNGRAPDGAR